MVKSGLASLLILSLLLRSTPAQEPPFDQAADLLQAAEWRLQTGHDGLREAAVVLLWDAEAANPDAAIRARITARLAEADPRHTARTAALTAAARRFADLGSQYRRRGWLSTAGIVLRQAVTFDGPSAERAMAALAVDAKNKVLAPDPVAPAEGQDQRLLIKEQQGGWSCLDNHATSPVMHDPQAPPFLITQTEHADHRLRVDVSMGAVTGKAAVMVGHQGWADYFLVELYRTPEATLLLRAFQVRNEAVEELASAEIGGLAVLAGVWPLTIDVRGNVLSCSAGEGLRLDAKAARPVRGRLGLFISGDSENRQPVAFLNVAVLPLPEHVGDARQARAVALAKWAEELLQKGEKRQQQKPAEKHAEAAALLLRQAAAALPELAELAALGDLPPRIAAVLGKADTLEPLALKARTATAAALAELAQQHAAAGWPLAASRLQERAQRLDPLAQTAALAPLRAAAVDAAAAREAARQQALAGGEADDAALVEWFGAGKVAETSEAPRWHFEPGRCRSPERSGMWQCPTTKARPDSGSVTVQLRLPASHCAGGFRLGGGDGTDHLLIGVYREGDRLLLSVQRRQGSSYRTLQYQSVPVTVDPDRWLALRLSWTPSSVQLECLGRRLRAEGVATVGWFGLYAGYASVQPAPIPFRGFLPPP